MGAFPFLQRRLFARGYVFNAETGDPVENARLHTSHGWTTTSDSVGFWFLGLTRIDPFNISISEEGFLDFTSEVIEIEWFDTLNININLLYTEFEISIDRVDDLIDTSEISINSLTIDNSGNGVLEWWSEKEVEEDYRFPPWEYRESFAASEAIDNYKLEGVVFDGEQFYVSSKWTRDDEFNRIYILDAEGSLVGNFLQPEAENRRGMRDLAYDPEAQIIWGGIGSRIYGISTEGDSLESFIADTSGGMSFSSIAWDSENNQLWASDVLSDIICFSPEGEALDSLDRKDMRIYGLAYWQYDADDHKLYILTKLSGGPVAVYKMNTDNGDTMRVATLVHPDSLQTGTGGIFIDEGWDKYSSVLMHLADGGSEDRIDLWHLETNTHWMLLEPNAGSVFPHGEQEVTLTFNGHDMLPESYTGTIHFLHNGRGETVELPVSLEVLLGVADSKFKIHPSSFSLSTPYPNPSTPLLVCHTASPLPVPLLSNSSTSPAGRSGCWKMATGM